MVTWSLYDDVTTKHFGGKIWYFKANKKDELPLPIVFNIWETIGAVKL